MYEKILNSLKNKYSNLGLGDKVLGIIAKKIEKTGIEEDKIENAIEGEEDSLKLMQSQSDSLRTLKTEMEAIKKSLEPKEEPKEEPKVDDNAPEWAKAITALSEQVKSLQGGLHAISEKEKQEKTFSDFTAKAKEAGVHSSLLTFVPKDIKEDQFEEKIKALAEVSSQMKQDESDKNLGGLPKPAQGGEETKGEVSEMMKNYIASTKKD